MSPAPAPEVIRPALISGRLDTDAADGARTVLPCGVLDASTLAEGNWTFSLLQLYAGAVFTDPSPPSHRALAHGPLSAC